MNIVKIKVEDLIPYINNPRNNENAVDKVASSIAEFGFKNPIFIDKNNVVVNGHTRLLASKKLGLKEVPCIVIDDLTDTQIKAFRIADNKTSEYAEWDEELLKIELEQLEEMDFDLNELSIDYSDFDLEVELDDFVGEYDEEDDVVEEPPKIPFSKQQDIWLLGKHRLMCGSSTEEEDVKLLMNGNKADMVFTDPPFGYYYQSNMRTKEERFEILKNDDKILDFMPLVKKYSNGFIFICTAWKVLEKWIPLFNNYFEMSNMIIWNKGGGGIGDLKKTFSTDYEVILVSHRGSELKGKRIGSVWDIKKDSASSYVHATQKPIELPRLAIIETTEKYNIILDLFGGSGSTLIASDITNRINYSMELDEKYVDVIVKRYINHKQNNGEDVYLLRNGNKIPYSEIEEEFNKEA